MKRFIFLYVFFLSISLIPISGQTIEELEDYFSEGRYFFARDDYEDALFYYLKLVAADPLNANFNFKVGESYLKIQGKEHLAIPYFERALKDVTSKHAYRKKSFEEKSAPLHAYFYLGNAYRMNNQLNEALEAYMKFIDSPYFHNNYNINVVDREIKSCERAVIIQDAPIDYKQINLGNNINSEFSEEKPVLSGDDNTLVFIRKLKFYDAVFYSRKESGQWQPAININPQLLSDGEYYPTGLSEDGKELLLVRKDGDSFDIYTSTFDGETWSKAEKLPGHVNTISSEIHASFAVEKNTMFVTSNRKGGVGGFDIWKARRNDKGSWGHMKNLGKTINTELDEQIAYQCKDHNVLFFSSKGHYTMGGNDIFYVKEEKNKWKIPVNLGYPINDTRDNLFYCPKSQSCKEGYYSFIGEDGFGGTDIYLLQIKTESILFFTGIQADN